MTKTSSYDNYMPFAVKNPSLILDCHVAALLAMTGAICHCERSVAIQY